MEAIWFALWFFLPAGIANATPVFTNKIPGLNQWNTPLDFGKKYRGKRIFGENKRWRGLLFGTLIGGMVGSLTYLIAPQTASVLWQDPTQPGWLWFGLGAALGFGALVGDAIESFFKRQFNVAAGESWFPFDQIDYIIGGLLASRILIELTWQEYLTITMVWFILHLLSAYIGYRLKLKTTPI